MLMKPLSFRVGFALDTTLRVYHIPPHNGALGGSLSLRVAALDPVSDSSL
jgi:hypothetical protein